MARKRPAKPAPKVTPASVEAAAHKGDFAAAVVLARQLAAADPTDAHALILANAVFKKAEQHELRGELADLRGTLQLLPAVADPARAARLWAMAGDRVRADGISPEPVTALHFADFLVRTKSTADVPPEWKAGYDAVLDAFALYSNGKDDAAREALGAIGLASPFLEWKLLLRGLLAWTANDDAKAVENFARLNAERYPARLAAPVRVQCDPAFARTQPPTGKAALEEQGKRLRSVGLVAKLNKVRGELASSRKLGPAFKAVEGALTDLKKQAPALLPKLADALYFAIAKRGEPTDLPKYTKLFGPPPADPSFHKLEAMVLEEIDDLGMSLQRWASFEGWLADVPAGWSRGLADRARAVILRRMAGIAADIEEDAADPRAADEFGGFFGAPARKPKAKKKPVDPTAYLKRAADLAPDWEPVAQELFAAALARGDIAAAEAAARRYLDLAPQSIPVLSALAALMTNQGKSAEALALRRRALAVNPLDAHNRHLTGSAAIAHARRLAVAGDLTEAEKLLDENKALLEEKLPTSYFALRSVIYRKTKRPAEADTAATAALGLKTSRLVARLYLHANAVLLKLKPKERTAAAKDLADALELSPTPAEAGSLLTGHDMYLAEGLKYTGQKTQEKKFLEVAVRAAGSVEGTELEFEMLAGTLMNKQQFAVVLKVTGGLMKRFPKNPFFPYLYSQAELAKSKGRSGYKVTEPLRKAKVLAEASTEERHKQLLPQIEELLKANDPFGGLFGGFFG